MSDELISKKALIERLNDILFLVIKERTTLGEMESDAPEQL